MAERIETRAGIGLGDGARRHADALGLLAVAALGAAAFFLFPSDLALLTRIISAGLFVLSLDLVVGYCGVATLGHAVPFGVAAYAVGNAAVHGLTEPLSLTLVGAAAGAAAGLASGAVILRATALPQLVLSIAAVQLVSALANKMHSVTGGSDGLSGISPAPVLGVFGFDLYGRTAYVFSLLLLLLTLAVLQRVVRSPFGLLCRGIRQDPVRIRAMGAPITPNLLKMYAISGAVAGIGGALAAITTGVVGLDSVSFEWSATALVMLVLGGTGTLYGGLLGTVVFMAFQHVVSAENPFHWLIMLGALLIAVVLFVPKGLQAVPERLRGLRPRRRSVTVPR